MGRCANSRNRSTRRSRRSKHPRRPGCKLPELGAHAAGVDSCPVRLHCKQKWPFYAVAVFAIVVLGGGVLRPRLGGDEQERKQSLDERLQSVSGRDPMPVEISALVGDIAG